MPKSLSNRDALVNDLQKLVIRYQSKPSSLLAELEFFMSSNQIHKTQAEVMQEAAGRTTPRWELRGFKSEAAMKAFENRADFPGWEAL